MATPGLNGDVPTKPALEEGALNKIQSPSDGIVASTARVLDHVAERKLCFKFDVRLLPVLAVLYLFNALDKGNLGNAQTDGLSEDLNFAPGQYNLVVSIFFVPFVVFAPPIAMLGKKVGPARALPVMMFTFGSMTLLTAAAQNFAGIFALRWFLGMAESAVLPLVIYYLTTFYRRGELARRLGIFYAASNIANAFSGLLAFGVFHIKSHMYSWRYLFIIEGSVSVLFAIFAYWYLPLSAAEAKFLNAEEKELAFHRIQVDSSSVVSEKFNLKDSLGIFKSPTTYAFLAIEICLGVPLQSVALFLPQIIQRLGYSTVKTNLYTVAPNVTGAVMLIILAFCSDFTRLRFPFIVLGYAFTFTGFIIYAAITDVEAHIRVAYFATFMMCWGTSTPSVLLSTWYNNNVAHEGRRVVLTSVGVPLANLMGLVASNIFQEEDAPKYAPALITAACFGATGASITGLLGLYMMWDNRRRNRRQGVEIDARDIPTQMLRDGPKVDEFRWFLLVRMTSAPKSPSSEASGSLPNPNVTVLPTFHPHRNNNNITIITNASFMNTNAAEPVHYIRSRIANACDGCKSRKVKCDGHLPCSNCSRRQRPRACHYSPQRQRRRRTTSDNPRSPTASNHETRSGGRATPVTPLEGASSSRMSVDESLHHETIDVSAEDETEVPREARLLCDAQGKLIFVGDCAPLSFFQSVRQLVTAKVGQNAFAPQSSRSSVLENAPAHSSQRKPGAQQPKVHPADVASAVSSYLSTTTALIHLFDHDRLLQDLLIWADQNQKPDDAVSIVNFLILAIGRQIEDQELAQDYFEYARDRAFAKLSEDLSVGTVQAFTLVTVYMLCSCQINGAFLFFGIAVRAAYSIGIHRTEVNARFGMEIHHQRDRLWKSLRVVDLFLSTSMGRPPATSDVDCTVPYHTLDSDGHETCDLLDASVQIFLILEGIVVEIYSRRKISLQLTEGISLQLREWSMRWLKQLKDIMESRSQAEAQVSGACQVLSTYYYAVMLVSRPFLMYEICRRLADAPSTATDRSSMTSGKSRLADACIDAASLMVDPIQELVERGVLTGRVPFLVSWVFASSLVLGVSLLGGFGRILEKYTRLSINALDHFAKHDTHATQYSLIAQSLLSTALGHLEKRELHERMRRTETSSQLFGLMPSSSGPRTTSPVRSRLPDAQSASPANSSGRTRESLDRTFLQHQGLSPPRFGDLDSAFLGLGESLWQTPDGSLWNGNFGTDDGSASAFNLFPLLDAGGGIDLAHHF